MSETIFATVVGDECAVMEFPSVAAASRELKIRPEEIHHAIDHPRRSAHGFRWTHERNRRNAVIVAPHEPPQPIAEHTTAFMAEALVKQGAYPVNHPVSRARLADCARRAMAWERATHA